MKRLLRSILLGVAMVGILAPVSSADAASPAADKKKERRFLKQLQRLPNGAAPPAKVKRAALKLVKLNPRKAKRFYKIATLKYAVIFIERKARFLAKKFRTQLDRSDLAQGLTRRLKRQITKIERRVIQFNEPTPTPYQAGFGGNAPTLVV